MSTFEHVPFATGEPTRDPTYPIPPPGEYYATARWVKELVDSTVARVDPGNVRAILDELLAAWDPSNAMQKIPGASENAIPKFDGSGQVMPSSLSLTELISLRDEVQTAVQSIESKVDKVEGKGLSTCDFTEDLRQKLEDLDSGALTLDKTLSVEGCAADALVVGQVTRQNREYIEALQDLLKAGDDSYVDVGSSITGLTQDFNELQVTVGSVSDDVEVVKDKLTYITDGLSPTDTIKSLHDSLHDSLREDLTEVGETLSSKVTSEEVVAILDEYMGGGSGSASVPDRIAALEGGKVNAADFEVLQTQVAGKADAARVDQLTDSVESLNDAVTGKVNTSDYEDYKTEIDARLDEIENSISGMGTEINRKRGLFDLGVYEGNGDPETEGDEPVSTDALAVQSELNRCRKIDDLEVIIVEEDEEGNEVTVETTLLTEKSLEEYLNNQCDIAERTYYG